MFQGWRDPAERVNSDSAVLGTRGRAGTDGIQGVTVRPRDPTPLWGHTGGTATHSSGDPQPVSTCKATNTDQQQGAAKGPEGLSKNQGKGWGAHSPVPCPLHPVPAPCHPQQQHQAPGRGTQPEVLWRPGFRGLWGWDTPARPSATTAQKPRELSPHQGFLQTLQLVW